MGALGRAIKAALVALTLEENNSNIVVVDEWALKSLTESLQPFFSYLIYEGACYDNNLIKVVYRRGEMKVDADVVEIVFRNFLRETFNLAASTPLTVWVYLDDARLYLFAAFSDAGRAWIQQQRNNQRSRRIMEDRDLIE